MKVNGRFKMILSLLVVAHLLAACGGTLSQTAPSAQTPRAQENIVVFTGVVEATTGSEWIISGQKIKLEPQISVAPGIAVGDEVKIEGNVLADGAVMARKIELSSKEEIVSVPAAEVSSRPELLPTSLPDASSAPEAGRAPDTSVSSTPQAATNRNEVFGAVQALTETTITVDGVTYDLTNITRFTDTLVVGDQVRLQLTVNADSTVTVRAVEKSAPFVDGSSGSGDGPNHDLNDSQCGSDCDGASDDHGSDHDDDHHDSGCQSGCGDDD